jgi:hypothetical protein
MGMEFEEKVRRSFRSVKKDTESIRRRQKAFQESMHEWIITLANENKLLRRKLDAIEDRLENVEAEPKNRFY